MEHIDLTTAAILLAALAALLSYRFGLRAGAARSARHIADLEDDYTVLQADYERVLEGSRKAAIARDNLQRKARMLAERTEELDAELALLRADLTDLADHRNHLRATAKLLDNLQQTFAVLRISGAQVQQHSNRLTELAERLEAHAAPEKAAITEAAA